MGSSAAAWLAKFKLKRCDSSSIIPLLHWVFDQRILHGGLGKKAPQSNF